MSQDGSPWATAVVTIASALLLTAGVIAGLVFYGGQNWLLPGFASKPAPQKADAQLDDANFGLAEYVDRTLTLDVEGRLTIDGVEYNDDGLRDYMTRLRDGGGVRVVLRVDSDGPPARRAAVEKICTEVNGLKPEMIYGVESTTPVAVSSDLETP